MSEKAKQVFEYAKRKRKTITEDLYKSLKGRAVEAVTEMMKEGFFSTEIELEDDDLEVIHELTKEIRELGYRYCLIEVQNEEEEIMGFRLRISVSHLGN